MHSTKRVCFLKTIVPVTYCTFLTLAHNVKCICHCESWSKVLKQCLKMVNTKRCCESFTDTERKGRLQSGRTEA